MWRRAPWPAMTAMSRSETRLQDSVHSTTMYVLGIKLRSSHLAAGTFSPAESSLQPLVLSLMLRIHVVKQESTGKLPSDFHTGALSCQFTYVYAHTDTDTRVRAHTHKQLKRKRNNLVSSPV